MSQNQKPQFRSLPLLRCPYCVKSPLLKAGSWFEFQEGCPICRYAYERESGYFIGAPWMISYPLIGAICLVTAIYFYPLLAPRYGTLGLSTLIAAVAAVCGLLFYPYARAIWMFGDHVLNPLQESERGFQTKREEAKVP